jgi:hypothetical protein
MPLGRGGVEPWIDDCRVMIVEVVEMAHALESIHCLAFAQTFLSNDLRSTMRSARGNPLVPFRSRSDRTTLFFSPEGETSPAGGVSHRTLSAAHSSPEGDTKWLPSTSFSIPLFLAPKTAVHFCEAINPEKVFRRLRLTIEPVSDVG